MNSIDYSYRPESYFGPMLADTRTIKRINGSVRRRLVKESSEDDLTGVPKELTGEVLDEVGIKAWGRIHPMFMGGEFLPGYMPGEVEIARICLKSTTYDVDSIRARMGAGRIHYRFNDEYDGETTTRKTSRTSVRPLTLQGLVDFIFTAKDFFEMLEMNFPEELEERLDFFTGESEFYPEFHDALVEKTIEDFFSKNDRILYFKRYAKYEDSLESSPNSEPGPIKEENDMFFDKELFVEAGKDPLLIRADQDLAALCGKLDDRLKASGIIYHPFLYRHEPTWYEKQIFVNDDGLLFSQGPKKYRAAWDLLSDALGKWTTYDFLRGPIEEEGVLLDPLGKRYYFTDPIIYNRSIVISGGKDGPTATAELEFNVILAGSHEKPDIEEFAVCINDMADISLLQGVLDHLGAKIRLTPTEDLIRQREYEHFKRLEEYRKENEKITKAFLSVIDDDRKPKEIFYLYKDLPRLPFGCGLKKFICAWLDNRSNGNDFSELGFERWMLEGRSEEICKRISEDWPDLIGPFNTMLAKLLNKIRRPDDRPPFNIRDPRYREYNKNKPVIEKELAWLCNPCRNTEKEEKDKNSDRLQLRRALPDKGLNERGLLSTIKDHGWKEKGSHDAIFDIIDRGDAAVMEALIKLEGSKILYSTLEYVKTNGNGIPEAYLSLSTLHATIITGNLQITAELIKNGADVNKKIEMDPDGNIGSTPLHLACTYFSEKIIFLLLDNGAICNTAKNDGRTPLHLAALKDKNGTVIRRMINAGADVNAKDKYGWTPLSCASRNGHLDVVIALMGAGADLNAKTNDGSTLLHFASYNGHTDIVTALINIGADINAKATDGDTPLLLASWNGHTDVAIALINAGADVNAKTNDGYKPLHIASKEGHTDFAKALINAGADVNAKTNDGDTPLLIACKLGHTDFATALINAGADVNAKNDNGDTPLHETCRNKHTDVVTTLINASADLNVKNNNSDTPLNIALKYDMTSVAKILREAGAVS